MKINKLFACLSQTLIFSALLGLNSTNNNAQASTLYVGSFNDSSVLRFDGETGAFLDDFISQSEGGLTGPVAINFSPEDGNFYVISFFSNNILRYEQGTGNFLNEFIPQSSGDIFFPQDFTFDGEGSLYLANTGRDTINIYDAQNGQFQGNLFAADESVCNAPFGTRIGPDGNLYFSCTFSNITRRHNFTTNQTETLGTASSNNAAPGGLGFDANGNLYVANFAANTIDRYNTQTGEFEVFINEVDSPVQPIFGPDGNLYVSSNSSQKVGQLVPGFVSRYDGQTGEFIEIFIPEGTGGLDGAGWLAFTQETIPESSSSLSIIGLGVGMLILSALKKR